MTREDILIKLKDIMRYTIKDPDVVLPKVTEDSDLYTDLGLTSVGLLYSVIAMEEMFGIRFDEDVDFHIVKDVIDFISEKSKK